MAKSPTQHHAASRYSRRSVVFTSRLSIMLSVDQHNPSISSQTSGRSPTRTFRAEWYTARAMLRAYPVS